MAEKRVIEYEAASELANDDWLLIDGVTEGTRKARPSVVNAELANQVNQIGNVVSSLTGVAMGHEHSFAPTYDETESYVVGDLVMYNAYLYKCTADTTGTWDSSKWQAVTVAEQLEESGKIDDVQVNGVSVVTDKVANIDLTDMQDDIDSKVADATVADQSILDENHVLKMDSLLAKANLPTGAISTIEDGTALPMPSLKVGIEAVQSGSGDPSPTNIRPITGWSAVNVTDCGVNFWSGGDVSGTEYKAVRIPIRKGTYNISAAVTSSDTDGTQSLVSFVYVDGSRTSIRLDRTTRSNSSVTLEKDVTEVRFYAGYNSSQSQGDTFTYADIQLEKGTTATTYTAYSGTTYTTALKDGQGNPLTCYGGELNNVNGVQRLTDNTIRLSLADVCTYVQDFGNYKCFYSDALSTLGIIEIPSSSEDFIGASDTYKMMAYNSIMIETNNSIAVRSDNTRKAIYVRTDGTDTTTPTGYAVLQLATPQQISQDNIAIATQDGTNNLWADSGDVIDGSYYRNVGATLTDLISRVEALENA